MRHVVSWPISTPWLFIMARTISAFTQDDIKEFAKMLAEKKSRAELQQFAMNHIPDYTTFLAATLIEFQEMFLAKN